MRGSVAKHLRRSAESRTAGERAVSYAPSQRRSDVTISSWLQRRLDPSCTRAVYQNVKAAWKREKWSRT
jgi:hypothetical protein